MVTLPYLSVIDPPMKELNMPLKDMSLPDRAEVRLTVKRSFSDFLDDLGELEAKEDIDSVLGSMRRRSCDE